MVSCMPGQLQQHVVEGAAILFISIIIINFMYVIEPYTMYLCIDSAFNDALIHVLCERAYNLIIISTIVDYHKYICKNQENSSSHR